ncbi:MAG TPA: Uma2 family endonuclease [Herpetosiphonaceae bacterium]|nr:Uma2 family endonuclease [Herpetosiphonaceae bacterium]
MIQEELRITAPEDQPVLPPGTWPKQGAWTIADWEQLPEDGNRYELIDGMLYVTSAPSTHHQWVNGRLYRLLSEYIDAQAPPPGLLFMPPFGVILPTGPVIPDLVYVHMRNLHILTDKRIEGVADLLVEIASPGAAAYDRREKQDAYARSGVPEYWWVDPGSRTVEVLILEQTGRYRPHKLVERRSPIPSVQLPGLQFPVESIFMPPDLQATLRREAT